MKKSNDYFEMLKSIALLNEGILKNITNKKSSGSEKLDFHTKQSELYEKLLDEFIAPIEREDIFILSRCLEDIFNELCSLEILAYYKNIADFREQLFPFESLFRDCTGAFAELKEYKSPKHLLKTVREHKRSINTNSIGCKRMAYSMMNRGNRRDFSYENEVYTLLLNILNSLYRADTEIERIIINNN